MQQKRSTQKMRKNHKFAALVAASLMLGTSFNAGLADAKVISGNDGGLIAEAVDTQRLMTPVSYTHL